MSVQQKVNDLFCDVFEDDDIKVTRSTTAADIDDWDSLMHVTLFVHIERAFGVRFTSTEIATLDTVGELLDLLDAKGVSA
jgi:acyl carrier protein